MAPIQRLVKSLALALTVGALAATPAAAGDGQRAAAVDRLPAASASHERPASSFSNARHRAMAHASSGIPLLGALLSHIVYRARPVVSRVVVRLMKRVAGHWTKEQLAHLYCASWYRYFGYNTGLWYWAANRYSNARWAWNTCVHYGYL